MMFSGFDFDAITRALPYLFLEGMKITVTLTILSTIGGIIFGTLLALMRLSSLPVVPKIAAAYVNTMRALPLVLVIFWFYFLMPFIAGWFLGANRPVPVGGFMSALITFILFESAYFAEIMRAGIQSVSKGQVSAGFSLGLNYRQVMSYVVLPQAFRNMLPVLLTQTIILFQDTSLVYVVSLTDFAGAAAKLAQRDGRVVEMYLFVALVYLVICSIGSYFVRRMHKRMAIIR